MLSAVSVLLGQVLIKSCHVDVYYLEPASGRDKSLHYAVDTKNGHVVQGFSPATSVLLYRVPNFYPTDLRSFWSVFWDSVLRPLIN